MKLLLILCMIFYLGNGYSQKKQDYLLVNSELTLVAKNNKHVYKYENGEPLKIVYRDSGNILKAKGRLLINNDTQIQLLPFHNKDIITINLTDISSIGLWRRNLKITSIILGGTGVATLVLAASMNQSQSLGFNIIEFGLIVYSALILWYEVVAIPTIFLSEQLSIRSEKKGYHFFIEKDISNYPIRTLRLRHLMHH
ncbi:MAG: hypothetical protein ABI261_08440 [Ginsengibacter sp.]